MEVLFKAEVDLGGEQAGVAEADLDLLDWRAALVSQLRMGPTQVVRRAFHMQVHAVAGDDIPYGLRAESCAPGPVGFGHGTKQESVADPGGFAPGIHRDLGPGWHGDGADPVAFTNEIKDHPALLDHLDLLSRESADLAAP